MKKLSLLLTILFFITPFSVLATSFEIHFERGDALLDNKDWDGAIREFQKAIDIEPNHAISHFYLGLAYMFKGREISDKLRDGTLYLSMLNSITKENTKGNQGIVSDNNETKELGKKAVIAWKKAISLDDTIWGAHYHLGIEYYNSGEFEKAEKAFKRTIELNPSYTNSYSFLAV